MQFNIKDFIIIRKHRKDRHGGEIPFLISDIEIKYRIIFTGQDTDIKEVQAVEIHSLEHIFILINAHHPDKVIMRPDCLREFSNTHVDFIIFLDNFNAKRDLGDHLSWMQMVKRWRTS